MARGLEYSLEVGFMTVVMCCMRLEVQPGSGLHDSRTLLHKAVQVGFMTVVLCCKRLEVQPEPGLHDSSPVLHEAWSTAWIWAS